MEKSISTCYLVQRMKYWMDATSYGTLRKFCNNEFEKNQAVLYALYDFLIFHTIYFLYFQYY